MRYADPAEVARADLVRLGNQAVVARKGKANRAIRVPRHGPERNAQCSHLSRHGIRGCIERQHGPALAFQLEVGQLARLEDVNLEDCGVQLARCGRWCIVRHFDDRRRRHVARPCRRADNKQHCPHQQATRSVLSVEFHVDLT